MCLGRRRGWVIFRQQGQNMRNLLIVMFILSLASCANEDVFESKEILYTEVAKGSLNGSGFHNIDKAQLVIDNEEDWVELKDKMDTVNDVTSSFDEGGLDFSEELIIAVITEVKNIYYEVEVDSIIEDMTSIRVHYTETGTMLLSASQPFHIVRIALSSKPVLFNE